MTTATDARATIETRSERDEIAARLIAVTHELALELHPEMRTTLAVGLDSDLDRDLGFDSLGRAELLVRLDRAFQVKLPDELIAEARTPRDMLQAVLAASPHRAEAGAPAASEPVSLPETEEPVRARTLLEALDAHVRAHPDRPHIRLWLGDDADECITYGGLDRAARRVAHGLRAQGLEPGDRAAIMLPTGRDFFEAFLGILQAGGIPVPIYPPVRRAQIEEHLRRQAGILGNAEAAFLITDDEIRNVAVLLYGLTDSLRRVATVKALSAGGVLTESRPAEPESTALIQYTSGSTGDPKGVVLSHTNLLANIRAMGGAVDADSSDVFVSWLPLYHDMGLIGAWLACLYYGVPTVIMSPLAFLADPMRWLRAMHRHGATLSAAPNFAFELCLKSISDADLESLDLSRLRMVVNGAEAVSPATLARFTERFARAGFRAGVLAPVYGLAENCVGLAFPPVDRLPVIDRIDREALSRDGLAQPVAADGDSAITFVACGQPLPGHEVRVVDDAGRELPDRRQGRLQFRGPSATKGYFRNPERTRALFDGDWLETGDLAYISDGDIYITGRVKDLIIRAGRNIYPHELEDFVGNIEGVRKGCVAAFASRDDRSGTERLVVMAETRINRPDALQHLRKQIAEASTAILDRPPDEIVLAPPGTVPKTSSGKIRRSAARAIFESGAIGQAKRALWLQLLRLGLTGVANRLRRGLRRMLELAYGAYWWGVLVALALVLWPLVMVLPRRAWRQAAVRTGTRVFLRVTGSPLEVEADGKIPAERVMLVANHASYLDGAILSAAIPGPLAFVAKEELKGQRVAGPFLARLGTLFVRRMDAEGGIADTRAVLEAARAGERIVSFPEGTLTRMPGLLPFHLGAFLVAVEAAIPVLPVTIRGTRTVLRGDQWFPRRGRITVHVGKPLTPDGDGFEAAVRLRDAARERMLARSGEPDLAHERIVLPRDGEA